MCWLTMALARTFTAKCLVSRGLLVRCIEPPRLASLASKKTVAQELGLPEPPKRPLTPYIRFLMYHQADLQRKFSSLPHKEISRKVLHLWQSLTFDEKNHWSLAYERDKAVYDVKYTDYMKMLSPEQIRSIKDLKLKRSREKLIRSQEKVKTLEEKKKRLEERLKNQQRIQKKKDSKELGKPKPPSPAFTLFLSAIYQEKVPLKDLRNEARHLTHQYLRNEALHLTHHYLRNMAPASELPPPPSTPHLSSLHTQSTPHLWKILREAASRWHSLPEETKDWYSQKAKNLQEEYQRDLSDWEDKMVKAGRHDLIRTGQQSELSKRCRTQHPSPHI